ncbi:5274_t:CDS:1, partial [Gigaspora margarita]
VMLAIEAEPEIQIKKKKPKQEALDFLKKKTILENKEVNNYQFTLKKLIAQN